MASRNGKNGSKEAKATQGELPEMPPEINPDIKRVAEEYRQARDAWMEQQKGAEEIKTRLLALMIEHKVDGARYTNEDGEAFEIRLEVADPKQTVKVQKAKTKAEKFNKRNELVRDGEVVATPPMVD